MKFDFVLKIHFIFTKFKYFITCIVHFMAKHFAEFVTLHQRHCCGIFDTFTELSPMYNFKIKIDQISFYSRSAEIWKQHLFLYHEPPRRSSPSRRGIIPAETPRASRTASPDVRDTCPAKRSPSAGAASSGSQGLAAPPHPGLSGGLWLIYSGESFQSGPLVEQLPPRQFFFRESDNTRMSCFIFHFPSQPKFCFVLYF